jgi:hypothetical protein
MLTAWTTYTAIILRMGMAHKQEISSMLEAASGPHESADVICDRYVQSSLVLQRLDGLSLAEIWNYNAHAVRCGLPAEVRSPAPGPSRSPRRMPSDRKARSEPGREPGAGWSGQDVLVMGRVQRCAVDWGVPASM